MYLGDDVWWISDQTLQALHETTAGEAQTTSIHANTGPETHMWEHPGGLSRTARMAGGGGVRIDGSVGV